MTTIHIEAGDRPRLRITRLDISVLIVALTVAAATALLMLLDDTSAPGLRIAYLRNSSGGVANIWVAPVDAPDEAEQVTFAEIGIYDFDISPDGRTIAYSEVDFGNEGSEIRLLDLRTGVDSQITNCTLQDAICDTPVWRPGGDFIAYERSERNSDTNVGTGGSRIWLLDLTQNPPLTYPLVDDTQVLGYDPKWSGDGTQLSFYDTLNRGILVYDMAASDAEGEPQVAFVPTDYGSNGALSPGGDRLIFPEMLLGGPVVHAYLQLADLDTLRLQTLTSPDENADDQAAVWSPDGSQVVISRRYLSADDFTRGHQLYLLDMATGDLEPLVVDWRYFHSFVEWSPDGTMLVMQRFQVLDDAGRDVSDSTPDVWVYDFTTGGLRRVAANAYRGRWVAAGD